MAAKRKLIEVSIPLNEINRQSAREKSIRHGHPSTLHLWWARRPLATARAVLFAQLVDDPSNFEHEYRDEAESKGYEDPDAWAEHRVTVERQRLFDLITRMVNWDNLNDDELFDQVRAEIMRSTNNNPPAILDPFAGGGTIPLEAQRLGLEAHASDLNPVAVLINKALIEIPPKFAGREPVFPGAAGQRNAWPKSTGLAEDVRRYGEWMRDEASKRIGHLYSKATLSDGSKANVIGWIWARVVTCPNPACGAEVPLISSMTLSSRAGRSVHLQPRVHDGRVDFDLQVGGSAPASNKHGQGAKFSCWVCESPISPNNVHGQLDAEGPQTTRMLAVVVGGAQRREYAAVTAPHIEAAAHAAEVAREIRRSDPTLAAEARGTFGGNAQGRRYGFSTFADYFTDRQLVALTTLADLVDEVRQHILDAALNAGFPSGGPLADDGTGAIAYADAVATYLGQGVSRTADLNNSLVTWSSSRDQARNLFSRQAISMAWDFVEVSPFANAAGDVAIATASIAQALDRLPADAAHPGAVQQADAARRGWAGKLVSTDPPYYDNIVYSDLADFFYVWLRRSLRATYPALLSTVLVPKAEELVANPYRHGGRDGAKKFFEAGFESVFARGRETASDDAPITVYYAFKQSETDEGGEASTGWETILGSIVRAGWRVTATWPVRSEREARMIGVGTNALASSVVLALRPRPEDAETTDRRGFIAAMKRELGRALRELQQGGIAPVDLPQSAIGPGMAVFSRYANVIESDGSAMTVRSALARINEVLDELLTEQEGDFDPTTRFAIAWYRGNGYDAGAYGDAENLARARATAVSAMERGGILSARAGKVQLYRPVDLPEDYDIATDRHTSAWEALQHTIRVQEMNGIPSAGVFLYEASRRADGAVDLDLVKELAYLLFQVAEKNGWTQDAISFNGIATSWSELLDAGRTTVPTDTRATLDFGDDE